MPRVVTTLGEAEHQLLRLESARTGKPQCQIVKDALRGYLIPPSGLKGACLPFRVSGGSRERVRVIESVARPLRRLVKAGHEIEVASLLEDLVTKYGLGDIHDEAACK